jgi:hypothetical protein
MVDTAETTLLDSVPDGLFMAVNGLRPFPVPR